MTLEELLTDVLLCPKIAIKAEKKIMYVEHRHKRNVISLMSKDGKYLYKMFIRISNEFIEDFSVGLIWTNPGDYININRSIILLRCQGPHDSKQPLEYDTHHSYHTHQITSDDIENKRYQKPTNAGITDKFHSFEQALLYFIQKYDIIGLDDILDDLPERYGQLSL